MYKYVLFFLQYLYVLLCILTIQKLWYCGLPIFWHMILSIEARLRFLSAVTTQTNVQVGGGVSWKDHRMWKSVAKCLPGAWWCSVVFCSRHSLTVYHFLLKKIQPFFLQLCEGPPPGFLLSIKQTIIRTILCTNGVSCKRNWRRQPFEF